MKAEINNENKAKFFAQYWGQKIVLDSILIGQDPEYVSESFEYRDEVFGKLQLELKPLSSISDEDAIEVARIALNKDSEFEPIEIIKWDWCWNVIVAREKSISDSKVDLEMYITIDFEVNEGEVSFKWDHIRSNGIGVEQRHLPNSVSVYDFLRSSGYLVPWMGLSCEELIEGGWAKYKE